jgi:hypothetical protein
MFKLGIFKKEQLTPDQLEGFCNSRKFIALDLYNSLDGLPPTQIDKIQERMLRWFRVHNGVLKCTYARRFDDFDRLSVAAIAAHPPRSQYIRVHDIGASDGRTSCGLYNHLNPIYGERLEFRASDYAPCVYVLKRPNSTNRLILDDQQNVLQMVTPPFVFILIGRRERLTPYPLNPLIRSLASIFFARPLLQDYKTGSSNVQHTRVDLLCGICRTYLNERDNFCFDTYDVLSGPTKGFDIIRAMNLLNHTYFSEAQLQRAVKNIVRSLKEGGLFITGSNAEQGTVVDGTIYKHTHGRLTRLEVSGKGSQIDAMISAIGSSA